MHWAMCVAYIKRQHESPTAIYISPEIGSEEHKWAEGMVAKGFLERAPLMLGIQ
jgi:hypothetical protein